VRRVEQRGIGCRGDQPIGLEWPSYGRRWITAELRRNGWTVNPKRVFRLMQEDNLLWVRNFIATTAAVKSIPT
jgi:HTH-like domain